MTYPLHQCDVCRRRRDIMTLRAVEFFQGSAYHRTPDGVHRLDAGPLHRICCAVCRQHFRGQWRFVTPPRRARVGGDLYYLKLRRVAKRLTAMRERG